VLVGFAGLSTAWYAMSGRKRKSYSAFRSIISAKDEQYSKVHQMRLMTCTRGLHGGLE
jgi:hypothetical protein